MSIAFWIGLQGDQFGFLFVKSDDILTYIYYTPFEEIVEPFFHFPKTTFPKKSARLKVIQDNACIQKSGPMGIDPGAEDNGRKRRNGKLY